MFVTLNCLQTFLHQLHFVNVTHHGKKQTILIYPTKFAQAVHFWFKTWQMNITIEISLGTKLHLDKKILLFGLNLPKKGNSGPKEKKLNITFEFNNSD